MKKFIYVFCFIFLFASFSYAHDYDGHWAGEYIKNAISEKTASGEPDGNFYPDRNVTRAEFISLLVNHMLNRGIIKSTSLFTSFNDIRPDSWYFPQIVIAEENGIIKGYSDGGFHPNETLTREDAVVFVCRAYNINPPDDKFFKNYSDSHDISDYAKSYIRFSVNNNIMVGYGHNTLRPKNPVSRAEALVILDKFKGISLNISPEFSSGYPKISPTGTVNNITLELKTTMPCTIFYKTVKKSSLTSYLTPKKEEINTPLASVSTPDTIVSADILLNSYDEEYTVFLMPVAEDGTVGTIKRIKDVKALAYEKGDGSRENPYIIYTESQLNHIRYCQDNYFKLANDIVLTSGWVPINASGGYFGSLDGDGHSIINLNISSDITNAGLFSILKGGSIKNLKITGNIKAAANAGLFAGKLENSVISDCAAIGNVEVSSANAGAIAGINGGTIENSLSAGLYVKAAANAGGIAGSITGGITDSGIIKNCISAAEQVTADMYAGSIAGINSGSVTSCVGANLLIDSPLTYTSGRITTNKDGGTTRKNYIYEDSKASSLNMNSDKDDINGMEISWNEMTSKSFYSANTDISFPGHWNISSGADFVLPMPKVFSDIGLEKGITPYAPLKISTAAQLNNLKSGLHYLMTSDIYFNSKIAAVEFSGSFDGGNHTIFGLKGTLFSEISDGAVRNLKLKDSENALIASGNYGTVENCSADGKIIINSDDIVSLGSIVQNNYGTIKNCDSYVNFAVSSPSVTVGGIAAQNEGFIDNCSYIGRISASTGGSSSICAGAIAGFAGGGFIYNCYTNSQIQIVAETAYAGGICGILGSGEIFKCSSDGYLKTSARAAAYSGGIAAMSYSGLINSSFSAAKITDDSVSGYAGGIAGYNIAANIGSTYTINTIYQQGGGNLFVGGICGFNESGFISDNAAVNPWIVCGGIAKKIAVSDAEFLSNNYSFRDMLPSDNENDLQNGTELKISELSLKDFYFLPVYKGGRLGWSSDANDPEAVWTFSEGIYSYKFPLLKGVKNQKDFANPIEFK